MVHQDDGEVYLTVKETVKRLGISRQALNEYARRGELTKYSRGLAHRVFFKESEVNDLLRIRPKKEEKHDKN